MRSAKSSWSIYALSDVQAAMTHEIKSHADGNQQTINTAKQDEEYQNARYDIYNLIYIHKFLSPFIHPFSFFFPTPPPSLFFLFHTTSHPTYVPARREQKSKRSTLGSIKPCHALPHVLLEQRLVVFMPPTERRSSLDDVSCRPQDPQLIHITARLVVRTQDVEFALAHLIELHA